MNYVQYNTIVILASKDPYYSLHFKLDVLQQQESTTDSHEGMDCFPLNIYNFPKTFNHSQQKPLIVLWRDNGQEMKLHKFMAWPCFNTKTASY